ncbi:MAG: hypothetical protein ACLFSQ_11075 [Candidatus Zixiibacteriota bacterium]
MAKISIILSSRIGITAFEMDANIQEAEIIDWWKIYLQSIGIEVRTPLEIAHHEGFSDDDIAKIRKIGFDMAR